MYFRIIAAHHEVSESWQVKMDLNGSEKLKASASVKHNALPSHMATSYSRHYLMLYNMHYP